jgi:hypothetical protein
MRDLSPSQLVWCREKIKAFAPAESDVMRRDESSKETYRKLGCWGEGLFYSETRPQFTALSHRPTPKNLPAERSQRHNRIGTQA